MEMTQIAASCIATTAIGAPKRDAEVRVQVQKSAPKSKWTKLCVKTHNWFSLPVRAQMFSCIFFLQKIMKGSAESMPTSWTLWVEKLMSAFFLAMRPVAWTTPASILCWTNTETSSSRRRLPLKQFWRECKKSRNGQGIHGLALMKKR